MNTVKLLPDGQIVEVEERNSLLDQLRSKDVYIKSSCGGVGSCGDCVVKVLKGSNFLNSPTFEEDKLLGNVFHITKERLCCQMRISGDVEIDISSHNKQKDEERLRSKNSAVVRKRNEIKIKEKSEDDFKAKPKKQGGFKKPRRKS